jgi:PAS domain S-box-containing protein
MKKENSQYARGLIEASLDPLFTINTEGEITDMNQATINATGVSRAELIGTDFNIYFTEPQKAKAVCKVVFKKGYITNYPLTIKDHKFTNVLFNGAVYKDEKGNVLGAVIVARDVTAQRKIERQLKEAYALAELAKGVAESEQVKAENAMRIAIDSVKSKQQFLSNMSHEIRTPMNSIIGFTKVVLKTDLNAKQKEYLEAIKTSGDALIVLINDILDLAKVDSGKMTYENVPFKMSSSIDAMMHLFDIKSQEKNIKLIKEYDNNIPDVLVGDQVRLHQIILNLLSNAVKFTYSGKIVVSVKLVAKDNEKATIEFAVSDTGIGIESAKIDTIFENFNQASSGTSRIYGGTGLGLAIVKQLVEGQNGVVNVESVVNKGSTFSFKLTFIISDLYGELVDEVVDSSTEIKNIKVLVVEDIDLNQLLMKTLLDDFGFGCEIAANGKIAIEKLRKGKYDIILMDLQMPVMNGFEATEYIRETMHSSIPIIALTADVTTVDLNKCKSAGMDDYISKPVNESILYSKIVKTLEKANKNTDAEIESVKSRCIDLEYLMERTKSNPELMSEMIALYLEQTPVLISTMKQSFNDKDWETLEATAHKMIPSFSIVGISSDFENMAKKVQEFASNKYEEEVILDMVMQLENICTQACKELEEELLILKK